jgi:tripartite-type tricarboxylate transporter receptor subunit TctC
LALPGFAQAAEDYPSKNIRIIVPNPPGGSSDLLARMIGEKLHQAWGQAVVVENRAGANGNIGSNLVAKAKTDGYTLLLTDVGALCISASVFPDLPFDPVKDFEPVTMVSYSPHVFAVHPSVPAKTVKEFIELAKSQPGKLNLATAGAGSAPHLAGVEFAARTGVQWTYIHYKGGSQAIADVVAGHANVLFNGMLPTFPYVKGGQLRALAVTSTERLAAAPEIPTMQESGLAGFETGSWQGVLAPRGTPREIVGKLNAEIRRILNLPDVRKMLASQGADVRADTPEVFGRFLASETARWARIVKQAGVKAE